MNRTILKITTLLLLLLVATGAFGVVTAQGDTLNIIYWQAPVTLNVYLAQGTKEIDAASLISEPLARYDENGNLIPWLVDELPTVENGGVSEDLTTITWVLKEGLIWSDGTPVTAADAVFTWQYCVDPATGCTQSTPWVGVTNVEAVDDRTVKVTFDGPKPFPYLPFVGSTAPLIQAAQFADCMGANAISCTEQNFNPVGTGPYIVEEFRAGDVITYVPNPNYREAGKPFFQHVVFKGGGDADSAARSVLVTGEFDYAWNLQVLPNVLAEMEATGIGTVVTAYGTSVERLMVNQTNPDAVLGENRSEYMDGANPHPFLTVPAVYQALSMAIDRNAIAESVYGPAGVATCNLVPAPAVYASPNNDSCLTQDIEGANALLDEAGIVDTDGDGIREHNGVPLRIFYQTTVNTVRQQTQALVKQWWSQIGVATDLAAFDAAVFFGSGTNSPFAASRFYADIEMFTNNFDGTDPESYMGGQSCAEVTGTENNWGGNNYTRWCSTEYDALLAELATTAGIDQRAALVIQMNDMVVQNGVMIPLIHRGDVSAHSNTLEGVRMNTWDAELWNIADWTRAG